MTVISVLRRSIPALVSRLFDYLNERTGTYVLCFDIVGLMRINDEISREAGDKVILESLKRINAAYPQNRHIFPCGGIYPF